MRYQRKSANEVLAFRALLHFLPLEGETSFYCVSCCANVQERRWINRWKKKKNLWADEEIASWRREFVPVSKFLPVRNGFWTLITKARIFKNHFIHIFHRCDLEEAPAKLLCCFRCGAYSALLMQSIHCIIERRRVTRCW